MTGALKCVWWLNGICRSQCILELAKEMMLEIVQNAPLSPIHVRARRPVDGDEAEEMGELAGDGDDAGESAFEEAP